MANCFTSKTKGNSVMERVAIFVDVQNIYYTTRQIFHCNFNYNVFFEEVTKGRELVKANAYAIDRGDSKQQGFQNILKGIGFDIQLKPFIQRSDGSAKGDWDVGITLDAIELAEQVDVIVLASGDGDFDLLAKRAKERFGTQVEVYGVHKLTANSLIMAAGKYVPIDGRFLLRK